MVPIEVKAGATGHLRSLHQIMAEKRLGLAVRVAPRPLGFETVRTGLPGGGKVAYRLLGRSPQEGLNAAYSLAARSLVAAGRNFPTAARDHGNLPNQPPPPAVLHVDRPNRANPDTPRSPRAWGNEIC